MSPSSALYTNTTDPSRVRLKGPPASSKTPNAEPCLGAIIKLIRKATIEKLSGPDPKTEFSALPLMNKRGRSGRTTQSWTKHLLLFFVYSKKDIYYGKHFANIIHICFFFLSRRTTQHNWWRFPFFRDLWNANPL